MNIPSCIDLPFIGLHGSCDDAASSGLYINDLEGMSFNLAANLANEEKVRGETFFRDKEKLAIRHVIRDFITMVQKDYTFKDIFYENIISGKWSDYIEVGKVGIKIVRCPDPFIGVEVREIAVFPESDIKVTLNYQENGKLIKQENITLIGGEINYIKVNINTTAQEYYLYTDFCGNRIKYLVSCNCDCLNQCNCNNCADVYSVNGEDLEVGSYFFFGFSILCRLSFDNLICNYLDKLKMAILYMTGIKILQDLVFTDRVNPVIANKKAEAVELLKIWEGVPSENQRLDVNSEYYKSLLYAVEFAVNYVKSTRTIIKECRGAQIIEHKF